MTGTDAGPPKQRRPEPTLGTTIAGYRLERLIGRGGMGVVYLADDIALGRKVAVKVLASGLTEDQRFRDRFLRESRLAASLDHPAIVPIHQAGEADGTLYIAMRYVDGTDLRGLLAAGPLPAGRALAILSQVASALDAAHRRGLVHRDVKPGNILLDRDEHAYLTDFGLSRHAPSQSGITGSGLLVGTVEYIAPEQIEGRSVDGRADVYSLGCVLFECLTGRRPFVGELDVAVLWAHVNEPPPTIGDAAVDGVLARALAKSRAERYETAGAFLADAGQALGVSTSELAARGTPRRRHGRLLAGAGALVAVALAVALAASLARGGGGGAVAVASNSVAVIDPESGRVTADVPVGTFPGAITFGDGALWVGNLGDNTLSRIQPASREVKTIGLQGPPTGIAVTPTRVWVAMANPSAGEVSEIDPQNERVVGKADVGANYTVYGLRAIAARDGDVWFANYDSTAGRIDPATSSVTTKVETGGQMPAVAIGFGSVWVGNDGDNVILRVRPANGAVIKTITVGNGPSNIAVGGGAVWVANRLSDSVTRIDPRTSTIVATVPVGRHPLGLAASAAGVWVANSGDGTVSKIDPRSNRVITTVRVGGTPGAVALAGGSVWVTVSPPAFAAHAAGSTSSGGVLRVDLPGPEFDSTDPAYAYSFPSAQLLQATCAKLMNYPDVGGPAAYRPVPEVARAWPTVSDGGKTYTFRIRPGFRFSPPSNAPVTAETFRYSIERSLSHAMQSPLIGTGYVDGIVGARAYEAGKAAHIAGLTAHGDTLTIRLRAPDPTLPTKLTMTFFCAVPTDTPLDPAGVPTVASAGPYYMYSHTLGRSVVLKRNPNYHGPRPHRVAEIDYRLDVSVEQAVADVESGRADYNAGFPTPGQNNRLRARYGPGSAAARAGHQQFFVNPVLTTGVMAFNMHRPLFASERLRRAVNYAIDRDAIARAFSSFIPMQPTDQYLPPGLPGFTDRHIYPFRPDVARARRIAGPGSHGTAILNVCNITSACTEVAQIVTADLRRIGIEVVTQTMSGHELYLAEAGAAKGAPFDLSLRYPWGLDYKDPENQFAGLLLGPATRYFDDPAATRELRAAARLSGTARYRAYGRLDVELTRDVAPLAAYSVWTATDFFSARVGCQVFDPNSRMDLAALCLRD
jgi:YVTN family beta-propeller protein